MYGNRRFATLFGTTVAATLLLSVSAFAHPTSAPDTVTTPVSVHVVNNNWLDIRVYVVSGARTVRLGTVTSFTSVTFKVPRWAVLLHENLVFLASPVGSRESHTSPPVLTSPGDVIEWRVENRLSSSTVRMLSRSG